MNVARSQVGNGAVNGERVRASSQAAAPFLRTELIAGNQKEFSKIDAMARFDAGR